MSEGIDFWTLQYRDWPAELVSQAPETRDSELPELDEVNEETNGAS